MSTKSIMVEQSILILGEAEVALMQGQTVQDISLKLGITDSTYYPWRQMKEELVRAF